MNTKFNKYLYIGYLVVGCYYLIQKTTGQALIFWGIALAFDPFNTEQSWNDRPSWQKLILLVHLAIVFGLVFIEAFKWFNL
jgi:hypothetical protein